jgi:hypothetical protein
MNVRNRDTRVTRWKGRSHAARKLGTILEHVGLQDEVVVLELYHGVARSCLLCAVNIGFHHDHVWFGDEGGERTAVQRNCVC